ncbi:MAG: hypothetical protein R3F34_18600 [Planctomycetota bacterium]
MRTTRRELRAAASARGTTLVEIVAATAIFAVIGYGMMRAASTGMQSERAVSELVVENRSLYEACEKLEEELSNACYADVVHEVDEQGWSSLEFQVLVETDDGLEWGARDRALGSTAAKQSRADWKIRYEAVAIGGGGHALVRRIYDEDEKLQFQEELVPELAENGGPAFTVEDTGAVWVVTIRYAEGRRAQAQEAVLHVTSKN